MYKCPKCGHWMQWREPYSSYAASYWICGQCGYSPETYTTNKTEVEQNAANAE